MQLLTRPHPLKFFNLLTPLKHPKFLKLLTLFLSKNVPPKQHRALDARRLHARGPQGSSGR